MDKIAELESQLKAQETQIKALSRQFERFTQALDEVRQRVGLSSVFWDSQVQSINARGRDRGNVA